MKICFCSLDNYWGGLSNNGGTRTILLSAETLSELGHEVEIVAPVDKFTWFKHKKPLKKIPKRFDAYIAIAITDVPHLMKIKGKLFYWARPFEGWQTDDSLHILDKFVDVGGTILCNSRWQVGKLLLEGIEAHLVYAGLDIEKWLK